VFNEFTIRTLCSIKNQKYRSFELILVANGMLVERYIQVKREIELIFEGSSVEVNVYFVERASANGARFFGLEKSTKDYVLFFDSDDLVANDEVFGDLFKIIVGNEPDIICVNIQRVKFNDGDLFKNEVIYRYTRPNRLLSYDKYRYTLVKEYGTNIVSKVVKRTLFKDLAFVDVPYFQDWNISSKLFPRIRTFWFYDRIGYYYVTRSNSISNYSSMTQQSLSDAFNSLLDIKEYFNGNVFKESYTLFYNRILIMFCVSYITRYKHFDDRQGFVVCRRFLQKSLKFKYLIFSRPVEVGLLVSIYWSWLFNLLFKKFLK
jgi:glycosyltransferase involved in cell wall biosynthesis